MILLRDLLARAARALTGCRHPLRDSRTASPEENAKRLLLSHLNGRQRTELRMLGRFTVRGNVTGFEYRVHPLHSFNITRVHDGAWLCAVPRDSARMPIGDVMLTLKLTIENDERTFLRAARGAYDNLYPLPDCTLDLARPDLAAARRATRPAPRAE